MQVSTAIHLLLILKGDPTVPSLIVLLSAYISISARSFLVQGRGSVLSWRVGLVPVVGKVLLIVRVIVAAAVCLFSFVLTERAVALCSAIREAVTVLVVTAPITFAVAVIVILCVCFVLLLALVSISTLALLYSGIESVLFRPVLPCTTPIPVYMIMRSFFF